MTPEHAAFTRSDGCQALEFERATTRKVIAAVTEAGKDYRPDPRARTAFELAWHIVSAEVQMLDEIADGKFSAADRFPDRPTCVEGVLAFYDREFPRALGRIWAMPDEALARPLDFYGAFNYPACMYVGFAMIHSVHHRGQLSTYLRPLGSKVPSIYGGSADEAWQPPSGS